MPLTIADLARVRKIPAAFLAGECRLHDAARGVEIRYASEDGADEVIKLRTAQEAGNGSYWPQGTGLMAYGLWRLQATRERDTLLLVEGESDCWALWHLGYPALGLPGADTTGVLEAEHLEGVEILYIHQEPDPSGERFVAGLIARLRVLRFRGRVLVWHCPQGVKDPAQLLAAEGAAAKDQIERRLAEARPVDWFDRGDAHEANGRLNERPTERPQFARVESCTHEELLRMDFPPMPWLVKDLVPDEGLTLLGGKKKLGKSWLALQMAQAIACGAPVLGRETAPGAVIYICLEDGRRRVRDRLMKQQTVAGLPITYFTRFPPLDGDGTPLFFDTLDALRPKFVIVDTLAAIKTGKTEENAAGPMSDIGNFLRAAAQWARCGIMVVHHHGKIVGGDPGDDLRGSSAVAAAADVNLGLYAEEGGARLRGEGRDIQQFSLALQFDSAVTWSWQLREDPSDAHKAQAHEEADQFVLDALIALGEADADTVAEMLQRSVRKTGERLRRLLGEKIIQARSEHTGRAPRILYSYRPQDHVDNDTDDEIPE
jgi:hypothetical protein